MTESKRLLVMAGGTGGHIFPGAAVAQHLQSEGWHIHWLGTPARMEAQLVPKLGFDISFIDVAGVRGNGLHRLITAPWHIAKAIWQARRVIKQFRPDVVLGMGGFASGPGGIAAWLQGVPLVIHEQNAIAGMTNNILRQFASKTLLGFPNAMGAQAASNNDVVWVGNPVRAEIAAVGDATPTPSAPEQDAQQLNILVVGGSLGAQCLNEQVPNALAQLVAEQPTNQSLTLSVQHQSGKGKADAVQRLYQSHENTTPHRYEWHVSEFIDDMVAAYRWADLVICRAGALTVAEVAAAGRSAIFVPLPHAVDDHQTFNARFLVDRQAGWLLPQPELEQGALTSMLQAIVTSPTQLSDTAKKARRLAKAEATAAVANICQQLAGSSQAVNPESKNTNVVKQSRKEGA